MGEILECEILLSSYSLVGLYVNLQVLSYRKKKFKVFSKRFEVKDCWKILKFFFFFFFFLKKMFGSWITPLVGRHVVKHGLKFEIEAKISVGNNKNDCGCRARA